MRIEKLEYYDKASDWRLETTLFSDLTLLVGVSGVGKTRILQAILSLKGIAAGLSRDGLQWSVEFSVEYGDKYIWRGEYDNPQIKPGGFFEQERPSLISEEIIKNGTQVIKRDEQGIFLRGSKTPKLPPFQSVVSILHQEEEISWVYQAFRGIIFSDFSHYFGQELIDRNFDNLFLPSHRSANVYEAIKQADLDSQLKLALLYQYQPQIFQKIKERFVGVFEQVEDVRIVRGVGLVFGDMEERPKLEIKERGVAKWILQDNISSGMYKTFMHLSEMFLWPDETVVLIDEFENSLGVNCLDILTEELLQENRRLQFIITSHHPYVINNISPKHWKIVQRQGGRVSTADASALRLDSSSQKAFIQLLNHEKYREGILAA